MSYVVVCVVGWVLLERRRRKLLERQQQEFVQLVARVLESQALALDVIADRMEERELSYELSMN